jgi:hypothetical protein
MTRQLLHRDNIHPRIEEVATERPAEVVGAERFNASFLSQKPVMKALVTDE